MTTHDDDTFGMFARGPFLSCLVCVWGGIGYFKFWSSVCMVRWFG